MAVQVVNHTYKFKRGSEEAIFKANPLLMAGEPIVVYCDDNITRLKLGDGHTQYIDLPFINQENDEALSALIREIDELKLEIHNAGDTVFQIPAEELESVKGETVSEKISAYIFKQNPIEVLSEGNLAVIKKVLDADEFGYSTYVYTKDEWIPTSGDYNVDNLSIEVSNGNLSIKGFKEADNQTVPYKNASGVLQWVDKGTLSPIENVYVDDKILSLEDKKIKSTLTLEFDTVNNNINLLGKDRAVLGTVDASKFLIQGMLQDVYYNSDNNTLTFIWNTADGIKTDTVELGDIIDPYQASSGIVIEGTSIGIKIDNNTESFLHLSSDGLAIQGVQNAIDEVESKININIEKLSDSVDKNTENVSTLTSKIGDVDSVEESLSTMNNEITSLKNAGYITDASLVDYAKSTEVSDAIDAAIEDLVADTISVTDSKVQSLEEDVLSLKSVDIEGMIDNSLENYPTSEQVDDKIKEAISSVSIDIIDGGRITDGNTSS